MGNFLSDCQDDIIQQQCGRLASSDVSADAAGGSALYTFTFMLTLASLGRPLARADDRMS